MKERPYSRAFAHSKLLLFGEHSAVYGFPAVGLPLPSKLTVTLTVLDNRYQGNNDWLFENIAPAHIPAIEILIRKLRGLIPEFQSIQKGKITITSDIVPARGLGSSAALCVAFVRAVVGLFPHLEVGSKQIWEWAHQCEHVFHGTPSGIDTGLAVHNRLCAFYPKKGTLPEMEIINNVKLHLLISIFRRHSDTYGLINQIRKSIQTDHETRKKIGELGRIARLAIYHFKENKNSIHQSIGNLALEAQYNLASLGLSNPGQELMLEAAINEGISGGKLSGAGGGGAFFLIAESTNQLLNLKATLGKLFETLPSESKPHLQAVIWENESARYEGHDSN